jgi:hypothetical protein
VVVLIVNSGGGVSNRVRDVVDSVVGNGGGVSSKVRDWETTSPAATVNGGGVFNRLQVFVGHVVSDVALDVVLDFVDSETASATEIINGGGVSNRVRDVVVDPVVDRSRGVSSKVRVGDTEIDSVWMIVVSVDRGRGVSSRDRSGEREEVVKGGGVSSRVREVVVALAESSGAAERGPKKPGCTVLTMEKPSDGLVRGAARELISANGSMPLCWAASTDNREAMPA